MQNQKTIYQQGKIQNTKFIDSYQQHLALLMKNLNDQQAIRLMIYQMVDRFAVDEDSQSFLIIQLCKMSIITQALSLKSSQKPSYLLQWKGKLKQTTKTIEKYISSHENLNKKGVNLFHTLLQENNPESVRQKFNQFFIFNSLFIHHKFEILWKILIFYTYLFQELKQPIWQRQTAQLFLQGFQVILSKKQKQLSDVLKIQASLKQQKISTCQLKEVYKQGQDVSLARSKCRMQMPSNYQQAKYRYNITIKEIMTIQINLQTIGLVQGSQAYQSHYMLFLIPFAYLLAQTLTYYSNCKHLYIYYLFTYLCQRINNIKNGSNPQLPIQQINNCLVDFLNFDRFDCRQICSKLAAFVSKHKLKMLSFIPFYCQIFSFHAFEKYQFVDNLFSLKISSNQRQKKMKKRIQQMYSSCRKYNNEQL